MALKMKVVLVGLGSIGKRHFRLLKERNDITIEVVEPDERAIGQAKEQFGDFPFYKRLEDALEQRPDVVWLATPTPLHMEQSIRSMNAGAHVFCEKPMASNLLEAKKIRDVVLSTGKVFSVGYYLHYWKGMTVLKKMIIDGVLGNVLHAHARVGTYITLVNSASRYQSFNSGSIFLDYAHQPDLLYWLFGKVPEKIFVSSMQSGAMEFSSNPNVADIIITYGAKENFSASIHLNYVQMPQRSIYEIVGDKAWALVDAEEQTIKVGYRDNAKIEVIPINQERDDIFRLEHAAFFDQIASGGNVDKEVESSVITQAICNGIIEAWKSGKVTDVEC
jgi:predicted dehydrogenase